jgi:hypothetical protein
MVNRQTRLESHLNKSSIAILFFQHDFVEGSLHEGAVAGPYRPSFPGATLLPHTTRMNTKRQSDSAITLTDFLALFALISLTSKERRERMLTGSFTKNVKKTGANRRYDESQQREKAHPFG